MDNRIKILYLFARPCGEYIKNIQAGTAPGDFMYGYLGIKDTDIEPFYSDKVFSRKSPLYILNSIVNKFIRNILGMPFGFDIIHCIRLLPEIRKADIVFATVDSMGLALLFLKMLNVTGNAKIACQTIGLYDQVNDIEPALAFVKKLLNYSDKIISYNRNESENIAGLLDNDKDRSTWIHVGIDTAYFSPSNDREEGFILSAGSDLSRDYATLFQAIKGLKQRVVVVAFPRNLKGLEVPGNVEVLYNIPHERLKELYSKAMFVVVPLKPSTYAAGQMVALQSMSMRKTVILTRLSWLKEYGLENGINCITVPPYDKISLNSAVTLLARDSAKRAEIAENAHKFIISSWNTENYCLALKGIFRELAEKGTQ